MFDANYWLEIFQARAAQLVLQRPGPDDRLTETERRRIAGSIATFQLGEQSEGRTLLKFAQRFAARRNIPALPAVTELFIKEEQHHAAQLAEFMRINGVPLKRRSWTDSIFRVLRKLAGFEAAVTVLVTAEMIGFVYYRALSRATGSRCLRKICLAMCTDEAVHLRYETQLLRSLRGRRGPLARRLVEFLHRTLLSVSARVVFHDHQQVLGHVGYTPRSFRGDCEAVCRMVMRERAWRPKSREMTREKAGHARGPPGLPT